MRKTFKFIFILSAALSLFSCSQNEHVHNYGILYPEKEATCLTEGVKSHYYCSDCGKYFDEGKNEIDSIVIPKLTHRYALSSDENSYICKKCGDYMTSGKETIKPEKKKRIFLGSSITNGYNAKTNEHYSMADMMGNDYLDATFNYDGVDKTGYFRKTSSVLTNEDGFGGTYSFDDIVISFDGDGLGTYEGVRFAYQIIDNEIVINSKIKKLKSFRAKYFEGDTVYKVASDGFSLSDKQPRWSTPTYQVPDRHSYIYLFEKAYEMYKDEKIDSFVIQLSTNDVGQYISSACTEHLPFGSVLDSSIKDSSSFDKDTSLGALEYLIAKAKEVWNCDVSVFSCHMDTSSYLTWVNNGYDITKVVVPYSELFEGCKLVAEKWGINFVDLWSSKDANDKLESNQSRYLSDSLHLTAIGYEATYYQLFRNLYKNDYPVLDGNFTYTFKANGEVVKTITFSGRTKQITLPVIPFKNGYIIKGWDIKVIEYANKVIEAIYQEAENE